MSHRSVAVTGAVLTCALFMVSCSDASPESGSPATTERSTTTGRATGEPSDSTTTTIPGSTTLPADDPATPEDEAAVARFCADAEKLKDDVVALGDSDVLSSSERLGDQIDLIRKDISVLRESASDAAAVELDALDVEFGQLKEAVGDEDQTVRDLLSGVAGEAVDTVSAGLDVVQRLATVCPD